jgi:hypothetical protein
MLYELRLYTAAPGKRDDLVKIKEEEIIPFQVKCGMVILGSFVAEENPDAYVWVRRFKDEEERRHLYAAVYESDHWKNDVGPRGGPLLLRESINVTRLIPTAKSPLQ